jgi:NitT/TauT family transport system ATP-binding protein
MSTPPKLAFQGIALEYPGLRVLDGIDLVLGDGEFLAIVGPSGCGKSTLLRLASGLQEPTAGRVLLDGRPVSGPPPGVGFMFQRDTLMPWANVRRNVEVGLELGGTPAADRPARLAELLTLVGLSDFAGHHPAQLSGGMRQRVALARLLAYAPDLYLLDEPFGALDAQTKITMGRELLRIWSQRQRSMIFVTHDIEEAVTLADRVVVMAPRPGRVRSVHSVDLPRPRDPRALRQDPRFRDICAAIWNHIVEEDVAHD